MLQSAAPGGVDRRQPFQSQRSGCGLDTDLVVHGRRNPLSATEITLCRLDRHVPEEELDLLQFASSGAAESGTSPAKVVRREVGHSSPRGELLNDVPCKLLGDALSPGLVGATDATKYLPRFDFCGFGPRPEFGIDPVWNRHRPDVTAFAAQVYDGPMSLPLLEVIDSELGYLVTSEPTRKQEG
jgi:hypothetical protein